MDGSMIHFISTPLVDVQIGEDNGVNLKDLHIWTGDFFFLVGMFSGKSRTSQHQLTEKKEMDLNSYHNYDKISISKRCPVAKPKILVTIKGELTWRPVQHVQNHDQNEFEPFQKLSNKSKQGLKFQEKFVFSVALEKD